MTRFSLIITFLLGFIGFSATAVTVDEVTNVHRADARQFVTDQAGALSPATVSRLNAAIDSLWNATSTELAVVVVDRVDNPADPDLFATELFEKWGIGRDDKDNGLLVLISVGDRKAVIRTGYGVEGAVPDVIAGRIIRNEMAPYFAEGDYDSGTVAAVAALAERLTDPAVADELRSALPRDSRMAPDDDLTAEQIFGIYLYFALVVGMMTLGWVIYTIVANKKSSESVRYQELDKIRDTVALITFVTMGCALPALLLLLWRKRRIRYHKRLCANCGHRMTLLDEETDNRYLTPSEDAEERLNSIDYDVWLCPECNNTEVIPYVNLKKSYTECPRCHARAMSLTGARTTRVPTYNSEGEITKTYTCRACGYREDKHTRLPRRSRDEDNVAATAAILGSMLGGRGGGGGFSGGSFGGGSTGGGGASGGW